MLTWICQAMEDPTQCLLCRWTRHVHPLLRQLGVESLSLAAVRVLQVTLHMQSLATNRHLYTAHHTGLKLSRLHFIAAVEVVVKTLGWERFIYMGHSMGCEHGLFYNTLHPGQIEKLILLDPTPSLQRLKFSDPEEYFQAFYDSYYSNYDKQNQGYKVYTREKAVETVMKARALTESQAELILSRNLIEIGDGLYRLSWDNRLKTLAPQNYMSDYYYELFSKNAPPILVVAASDGSAGYVKGRESANQLIEKMAKNLKNFHMVTVEGGHDVHFTHPDKCVGFVREFMDKDHGKSKL